MYIIHGENTGESRKKLDEILAGKTNIKRVDGKKLREDEIQMLFAATELFAQEKVIVIENCKGLTKPILTSLLSAYPTSEAELILWQDGNYDARLIKKFNDAKVFAFPLPKYYFVFLDNLMPKKGNQLHETYQKLLESFVPEQIFFSLIKRVRQLLIIKTANMNEFEEFAKMNSWQRNKLEAQARAWSEQSLKSFYASLYRTETALKTSNIPTNLGKHIDILLLTELH